MPVSRAAGVPRLGLERGSRAQSPPPLGDVRLLLSVLSLPASVSSWQCGASLDSHFTCSLLVGIPSLRGTRCHHDGNIADSGRDDVLPLFCFAAVPGSSCECIFTY